MLKAVAEGSFRLRVSRGTIDKSILEKTLEFAPGEWLLSSYIATGMENVHIFIKADKAEDEIKKYLDKFIPL